MDGGPWKFTRLYPKCPNQFHHSSMGVFSTFFMHWLEKSRLPKFGNKSNWIRTWIEWTGASAIRAYSYECLKNSFFFNTKSLLYYSIIFWKLEEIASLSRKWKRRNSARHTPFSPRTWLIDPGGHSSQDMPVDPVILVAWQRFRPEPYHYVFLSANFSQPP